MDKITWQQVVKEWDDDSYHMMEHIPPWKEGPWENLCLVSEIPKEWWSRNCSAQRVWDQRNVCAFAMWQDEALNLQDLREFRSQYQCSKLVVLTIKEEFVLFLLMDLATFVKDFSYFLSSRQLQSLRVISGLPLFHGSVIGERKEERTRISIFLVTKGPLVEDVLVFKGDPSTEMDQIFTEHLVFVLCSKPQKEQERLQVPVSVRHVWLQKQFVPSQKESFLDKSFYEMSLAPYSMWSFGIHTQQVRALFDNLDKDTLVIAPGDGIGVCQRMWQGRIVAGDRVSHDLSRVETESFSQTIARSEGLGGNRILVLSYVWSLLTDSERSIVENWQYPVAIIDVKPFSPLLGFVQIGPGVFARGHTGIYRSREVERNPSWESVQYSENLLALPSVRSFSDNMSVKYWKAMRPLAKQQDNSVLVVHDLEDFLYCRHKISGSFYLSLLGKVVVGPVRVAPEISLKLNARTFYVMKRGKMDDVIRDCFSYAEDSEEIFFCTKMGKRYVYGASSTTMCERGQVIVREHEKEQPVFKVLVKEGKYLRVQTVHGELLWNIESPMSEYLVYLFCQKFGSSGWQQKMNLGDREISLPNDAWMPAFDRLRTIFSRFLQEDLIPDITKSPLGWRNQIGRSALMEFQSEMGASEKLMDHLGSLKGQLCAPWLRNTIDVYLKGKSKKKK